MFGRAGSSLHEPLHSASPDDDEFAVCSRRHVAAEGFARGADWQLDAAAAAKILDRFPSFERIHEAARNDGQSAAGFAAVEGALLKGR